MAFFVILILGSGLYVFNGVKMHFKVDVEEANSMSCKVNILVWRK